MKVYIKYKLASLDGVYQKDKKKAVSKPKVMQESYIESENKHWEMTGFIYIEDKEATKEYLEPSKKSK